MLCGMLSIKVTKNKIIVFINIESKNVILKP